MSSSLLLCSATPDEARPLHAALHGAAVPFCWGRAWEGRVHDSDVVLLHPGVGKANTAAGLALALQRWQPAGVIQFGIGGAFSGSALGIGMLAVASVDVHVDCGAGEGSAWEGLEALGFPLLEGDPPRYNEMPTDPDLSRRLAAPAGAPLLRFATSERATGSLLAAERMRQAFGVAVESMEGAAAAQVCLALGVPFAEIRGVSNRVGERDRQAWDIPGAVEAVNAGVLSALPGLLVTP